MEGGQAVRQRRLFHPQGEKQHCDELFEVRTKTRSIEHIPEKGYSQDIGGSAAGVARGTEPIGRGASGRAQTGGRGWRINFSSQRIGEIRY